MTTFCILLAAPRSGTTLLGDAVANSFAAGWPQEIFNKAFADPTLDYRSASRIHQRTNFFNYYHEVLRSQPALSYPSKENQTAIFRNYLQNLAEMEQAERFIIDIKYSSWHHLNGYWHLPLDRPGLVRIVRDMGLPVVHLRRRNLFALYCSLAYAEATGVWAVWNDRSERRSIVIDTARCKRYMTQIETISSLFSDWFSNHPVFELEYETLLSGEHWSVHVRETFAQIFEMPPSAPFATKYRKVTPPLREVVSNAEEVLAALRGSRFETMAEEAMA